MLKASECRNGQEQHERFSRKIRGKKKMFVQYDYRHTDGELFSCTKPSLNECKAARDKWLANKNN